jgi:hypothetical protein
MRDSKRVERWRNLSAEELSKLSPDKQAYISQAIESYGKKSWAASRSTELIAAAGSKSPISKDMARGIVILLGAMTFSAASAQVAKQTLSGSLVIPASLVGGVFGGLFGHEMGSVVATGLLLKNSTDQSRRSINKRRF